MTDNFYPTPEKRSLFNRITTALSVTPDHIKTVTAPSGSAQGILAKIIGDSQAKTVKRDIPAYLKGFNELPWLRRAVTTLANQLASNDWDILVVTQSVKGGELHTDISPPKTITPLQEFLNNPNPDFSFQQLEWLTHVYLELVGEAYWWMVPIAGDLKAYPISPDKVVQTPTIDDPLYHISGPQGDFTLSPDDIIHFTQPDPVDPYGRGTGLAQSLSHDLDTDDAASRFVLTHFNNNARPPLLIYGEGLNAERTKQLEEDWNQQHQGFWNTGKARFLSRKVEIKELSQKFEGAEIVQLRQHQRDIIASVIGVPPEIMGILTASNRATIDAADLFFSRYSLRARLDFVQEVYNKQLLPRFDDTGTIVMKFVNPVAKDKELILKAARFMPSALMVDEWRELMEFDPLEDGDGKCFIVPMNMQVLKQLNKAGQQPLGTAKPAATSAGVQEQEQGAEPNPETPAEPAPPATPTQPGEAPAVLARDWMEIETPYGFLKGRKVQKLGGGPAMIKKVASLKDITLTRPAKKPLAISKEKEEELVKKALDAIYSRNAEQKKEIKDKQEISELKQIIEEARKEVKEETKNGKTKAKTSKRKRTS